MKICEDEQYAGDDELETDVVRRRVSTLKSALKKLKRLREDVTVDEHQAGIGSQEGKRPRTMVTCCFRKANSLVALCFFRKVNSLLALKTAKFCGCKHQMKCISRVRIT